jgi:hypothetical protein
MRSERASSDDCLLRLHLKAHWPCLDAVREFASSLARLTVGDEALAERLGMIVHELVENAMRYGDERGLDILVARSATDVLVRVANSATDEHAEKLHALIDSLAHREPREAYIDALRLAPALPADRSGLGLPRIRCEGQMALSVEMFVGSLAVTARGTI